MNRDVYETILKVYGCFLCWFANAVTERLERSLAAHAAYLVRISSEHGLPVQRRLSPDSAHLIGGARRRS